MVEQIYANRGGKDVVRLMCPDGHEAAAWATEVLAEMDTEAVLREANRRLQSFGVNGFGAGEVLSHFVELIEQGIVKEAADG